MIGNHSKHVVGFPWRRQLPYAMLFLGVWAGVIAVAIILELMFNSGTQAGS